MQPKTILAFDTSAAHCAAALLLPDGSCLTVQEEMTKGQAERLMPMLEELLAKADKTFRDLGAIGVGTGPGNFTGIRISVAAARGLALALGIPAIGVNVFEALAHGAPRPVAVVQDARHDEVYLQIFAGTPTPATLLPHEAAQALIKALPVIGTGAAFFAENPSLPPAFPMAEAIARVASERLGQPHPKPAPFYLRGADAAPSSDLPPVILDA